jgi:hypothetical protein
MLASIVVIQITESSTHSPPKGHLLDITIYRTHFHFFSCPLYDLHLPKFFFIIASLPSQHHSCYQVPPGSCIWDIALQKYDLRLFNVLCSNKKPDTTLALPQSFLPLPVSRILSQFFFFLPSHSYNKKELHKLRMALFRFITHDHIDHGLGFAIAAED